MVDRDLRKRTKAYALRIIRLYTALPKTSPAQIIGNQFLRSGTSVGAHHREAHRARSDAEFISKMEVALQELDETSYWLELLVEAEIASPEQLADLIGETNELIAMFVASVRTVKERKRNS